MTPWHGWVTWTEESSQLEFTKWTTSANERVAMATHDREITWPVTQRHTQSKVMWPEESHDLHCHVTNTVEMCKANEVNTYILICAREMSPPTNTNLMSGHCKSRVRKQPRSDNSCVYHDNNIQCIVSTHSAFIWNDIVWNYVSKDTNLSSCDV